MSDVCIVCLYVCVCVCMIELVLTAKHVKYYKDVCISVILV